jgi:hypothetical protein
MNSSGTGLVSSRRELGEGVGGGYVKQLEKSLERERDKSNEIFINDEQDKSLKQKALMRLTMGVFSDYRHSIKPLTTS